MLLINKVWPLLIVGISKLAPSISILAPPLTIPSMFMNLTASLLLQINPGQRMVTNTSRHGQRPIGGGAIQMEASSDSRGHMACTHWPPTYPVR